MPDPSLSQAIKEAYAAAPSDVVTLGDPVMAAMTLLYLFL
jgi:hypothetical protein